MAKITGLILDDGLCRLDAPWGNEVAGGGLVLMSYRFVYFVNHTRGSTICLGSCEMSQTLSVYPALSGCGTYLGTKSTKVNEGFQ